MTTQFLYQKFNPIQEPLVFRAIFTVQKALVNRRVAKLNAQTGLGGPQPKLKHWLDNFLNDHRCELDKNCRILQLSDPLACEQVNKSFSDSNECDIIILA